MTDAIIIIIIVVYIFTHQFYMYTVFTCSNQTDEPLPNIMWCRDLFMEALNEIDHEDIN